MIRKGLCLLFVEAWLGIPPRAGARGFPLPDPDYLEVPLGVLVRYDCRSDSLLSEPSSPFKSSAER